MKKFFMAVALGTAMGLLISEVPDVKDMVAKGKKKVKNLTK